MSELALQLSLMCNTTEIARVDERGRGGGVGRSCDPHTSTLH